MSRTFARGLGRHRLRRLRSGRSFCPRLYRWRRRNWRLDCRTRHRMLGGFLLLCDRAQHIARSRNMREVDLGLDLFFAGSGARRWPRRTRRCIGTAAEMFPHQVRFVIFQRTGVRFLLRDTHRGQCVKNFLALDFQLTGQIVNSNLTHPLSFPLLVPLISRF